MILKSLIKSWIISFLILIVKLIISSQSWFFNCHWKWNKKPTKIYLMLPKWMKWKMNWIEEVRNFQCKNNECQPMILKWCNNKYINLTRSLCYLLFWNDDQMLGLSIKDNPKMLSLSWNIWCCAELDWSQTWSTKKSRRWKYLIFGNVFVWLNVICLNVSVWLTTKL